MHAILLNLTPIGLIACRVIQSKGVYSVAHNAFNAFKGIKANMFFWEN